MGRADEAVAELEAVLAAAPDFPHAAVSLGVARSAAGRQGEAITVPE